MDILIMLIFVIGPIGIIVHELGHALSALLVKADKILFTIGIGKKIKTFQLKRFVFNIHTIYFIGGVVEGNRAEPFKRFEQLFITMGGPIINIIFAAGIYYFEPKSEPLRIFMLFNLWLAIINIIPYRIGKRYSDGYVGLKLIFNKGFDKPKKE